MAPLNAPPPTISEEPSMQTITTIGLDIAKSVFQVHGVDAAGQSDHPPSVEASLWASAVTGICLRMK